MNSAPRLPSRRRFTAQGGAALLTAPLLLGSPVAQANDAAPLMLTDLAAVLPALDALARDQPPVAAEPGPAWAPMLVHCAQSIEYSMSGFPEPRSALFQATAGRLAFNVFAWRGRMSHDLAAPIPGAPSVSDEHDARAARARLERAIEAFRNWEGPLRPHFAYGLLARADYERAHAMHLAEHLSAFRAEG